jgi:hypothetical protein
MTGPLLHTPTCAFLLVSMIVSPVRAQNQQGPLLDDDLFWSSNRKYLVGPGPRDRSTIVFLVSGPRAYFQELWRIPGWSAWNAVSDDGDYIVRCIDGSGRRGGATNAVIASIYRRAKLVKSIRLGQIILDDAHLDGSEAPTPWGRCKGFVSLHQFAIETIEHRRLEYDVTKGELVSVTNLPGLRPADDPNAGGPVSRSPTPTDDPPTASRALKAVPR